MRRNLLKLAVVFVGMSASLLSGTFAPPTFNRMVEIADSVVEGEVTAVRCEWKATPQGNVIVTRVTVKVESALKGEAGGTVELEQLGGRVGDVRMEISDAPVWVAGSREVLFISQNGKAIFPTVAANFGRFLVKHQESGVDLIERPDGSPVFDSDLGLSSVSGSGTQAAPALLTLNRLKESVKARVSNVPEAKLQ